MTVTDLDEQGGHPLRGVVVVGHAVDHPDGVEEAGNAAHHLWLYVRNDTIQHAKTTRKQYRNYSNTMYDKLLGPRAKVNVNEIKPLLT